MAENNEPVGFLQLVRISEYSRVMRAIQLERERDKRDKARCRYRYRGEMKTNLLHHLASRVRLQTL